jgi:hypothetical protein
MERKKEIIIYFNDIEILKLNDFEISVSELARLIVTELTENRKGKNYLN